MNTNNSGENLPDFACKKKVSSTKLAFFLKNILFAMYSKSSNIEIT